MLNKLDASNQELTRRMDRFECNGSISSTPLTSPTIPPVNPTHASSTQQVAFPPHSAHQSIPGRSTTANTGSHALGMVHPRLPAVSSKVRDAVAPKVDVLRSIPFYCSVTAISQLRAAG